MEKKQEEKVKTATLTRAQKTSAVKSIVREVLAVQPTKHNDLIDEVAKRYVERFEVEGADNPNDVKGRIGSVLDIMKKESEVMSDGGTYALKARLPMPPPAIVEEKTEAAEVVRAAEVAPTPAPKKRGAKKAKAEAVAAETVVEEEKETPKKRTRAKKAETTTEEKTEEAPKKRTKKVKELSVEERAEEKSAPKRRTTKKTKAEKVAKDTEGAEATAAVAEKTEAVEVVRAAEVAPAATVVEVAPTVETPPVEEKAVAEDKPAEEKKSLVVAPKAEVAQKGVVMDMSFLFGDSVKAEKKPAAEKLEPKKPEPKQPTMKKEERAKEAATPVPQKTERKPAPAAKAEEKAEPKKSQRGTRTRAKEEKPMTAEEKLCDAFLKKLRALGGDYFEYYSVYLLERYSMKNGRRLEGLRISGGDHDGGIDGEIELTDALGFKETIYIQSKNWDPDKGKEDKWVVGETLLQQFIGACACRKAKDGKQHTRGIFITTSRFTPDAKRILEDMSDTIVGYDGNDLFETAKECGFGIVRKNGEWALDEQLLSGTKAFFHML